MLFNADRRDPEVIQDYAAQRWQIQFPGQAGRRQQLAMHLQALLAQPLPETIKPDLALVDAARQQLRRVPVPQRLYSRIKAQQHNARLVNFYPQAGGDALRLFGLEENSPVFNMPFLYTKAGYKNLQLGSDSTLLQQLADEHWIYGTENHNEDFTEAELESISQKITRLYLHDYSKHWENFLSRLSLSPFNSTQGALTSLDVLSDYNYSPLVTLIELINQQTTLTPTLPYQLDPQGNPVMAAAAGQAPAGVNSLTDKALQALNPPLQPTSVDLRFKKIQALIKTNSNQPAKIHSCLDSLHGLYDFMQTIHTANNPNEAAYKAARSRFQDNRHDQIKALRTQARRVPEPLKKWLNTVADNAWRLLLDKAKRHIDASWQQQVYANFQNSLSDRYPLARNFSLEAPIHAFNRFFKPGGIEHDFVASYLKPFIDMRRWKMRTLDNRGLRISSNTLRQLQHAEKIRTAFFSQGSSAAVGFKIRPSKLAGSVQRVELTLGDKHMFYSHGPVSERHFKWHGGEDTRGGITFKDLKTETEHSINFDGDWAWFRLLDTATMERTRDAGARQVTLSENGRFFVFNLISKNMINPFESGFLSSYQCPRIL
jgi:type VI secretion system protein ImpL